MINIGKKEIFLFNLALAFDSEAFEKSRVDLIENSSEEIRDLAIEIEERFNGNWIETKEDLLLQEKLKRDWIKNYYITWHSR